jgi:predicted kinase
MTRRVYDVLAAEAAAMLAGGYGAIVDAVFARESERRAIEEAAARHDVPFMGLWLAAPLTTMAERVGRRQNDASDATVEIVRRQQVYDIGQMTWLRIDASGTLTDVAEKARAAIRLSPKPHRPAERMRPTESAAGPIHHRAIFVTTIKV